MYRLLCLAPALAALGLAAGAAPAGPGQEKPAAGDAVLKRFVDEFIPLTPGKGKHPASYVMGTEGGEAPEKPAHKVTFAAPFAVARYEVTQELYQSVMGQEPSKWKGPRNSVEKVTWDEAVAFCRKATEVLRARKLIRPDEEVRLPSEAEWEYACRAGTTTAYSFGDAVKDLTEYAWYKDNSKGHDPPVGKKRGNPWGFHDMHGYVWEWVADGWHPDYKDAPADGSVWQGGQKGEKVIRGGSWAHPADMCRSAYRRALPVGTRSDAVGFRCVRAGVKTAKGDRDAGK
jgi:formylglycine-generating enzyme required for sulfatase activity